MPGRGRVPNKPVRALSAGCASAIKEEVLPATGRGMTVRPFIMMSIKETGGLPGEIFVGMVRHEGDTKGTAEVYVGCGSQRHSAQYVSESDYIGFGRLFRGWWRKTRNMYSRVGCPRRRHVTHGNGRKQKRRKSYYKVDTGKLQSK
jgi:hypothetical protein